MAQQYIISIYVEDLGSDGQSIEKLQSESLSILAFETWKHLLNFSSKFTEEIITQEEQLVKYELVFWNGDYTLANSKKLVLVSSNYLSITFIKMFNNHLETYFLKKRRGSRFLKLFTMPPLLVLKLLNSTNTNFVESQHLQPVTVN